MIPRSPTVVPRGVGTVKKMCGRFTSLTPPEELAAMFAAELASPGEEFRANYNVAPSTQILVVARGGNGERRLGRMTWGLVPSWTKERRGSGHINARAETVAEKPSFRSSFRSRRCLVPMDGYYEWRTVAAEGPKRAVYVTRTDGRPMAVAGLWSTWNVPGADDVLRTCCVITTAANAALARVHDRMPAVVEPEDWSDWLGESQGDERSALDVLVPAREDVLMMIDVGSEVNSVRNNGPHLIVAR